MPPDRTGHDRPHETADATTAWTPDHPTDVVVTLARLRRGTADPTHRVIDDTSLWRTTLTDHGPATLHLQHHDDRVTCRAWGPGAHAALDSAPDMCGARDDPTGFDPAHPLLRDAHRRWPGLRIPRTGRVLEALIPAVLEQRVIGLQATAGWRQLVTTHGSPAPGPAPPGMRVVPSAAAWAAIPVWDWHRAGIDPRRARTASVCATHARRLEEVTAMTADTAASRLRAVPGVGVWTAAEVAQRALGDADALSVGDYHLADLIGHTLFRRPFTDADMITALQPWRPHRYRVVRLLECSGHTTRPRHGPKLPFNDHRRR